MQKIFIIATALAIAAPVAANAAVPTYNYLDLGYSKSSAAGLSGGAGYAFGGSYDFYSNWFVAADYGHNSFNGGFQTGGFFTQDYTLTIGGHLPITESVDFVGRVSYADDHWKQGPSTNLFPGFTVSTSDTKSGYDLGFGIRAMVLDQLELNVFVDHDDAGLLSHDHTNLETLGSVGAIYNFNDQFGLGLSYARSNQQSASSWMLTGRWYFQGLSD